MKPAKPATAPKPAPSASEAAAIAVASAAMAKRRRRLVLEIESAADGSLANIEADHNNSLGFISRLENTFGTRGQSFATSELNHILQFARASDGKIDASTVNAMIAVIDGIAPDNEVEAMLALQMVVTHRMAMELMRRSRKADHAPQLEINGHLAIKLLRTFTMQIEALGKMRRGGEQTVRVEHVHVYPGGQAIVGTVNASGGGGSIEKANQAHAKDQPTALAAENLSAVRGANPMRDAMPIACGTNKDAMPNARRGEGQRRAVG